eukprot:Nitzschia sp. Nitz4//scaffold45_size130396//8549//11497//NITZ4_003428-RA/size130396-processed-gene-0.172-mRNA-1//1//CDS//3329552335//6727//frame0
MTVVGRSAAEVAPLSTMASAMMFATIMFAAAALATRAYLTGDRRIFEAAANPRSTALEVKSLTSVYTLLFHFSVFGFILLYAYVCEYHPPFPHADKNYDGDLFFFLTFLLFLVSFFTWKRHDKSKELKTKLTDDSLAGGAGPVAESNDKTEILNRDQTEEWKGWMQFMFLLYHYYHAEEVYNCIRILITCYVWMTGFGNFSFFYLKGDFGAIRVLQMLWRLNFLVLFLCLTQGTTFILYYICLLHTYYFFMVYAVMRVGANMNHNKWWVRIKLAVLGVIIFLVWDCDFGLFKMIHYPFFGETPMQGATGGAMWEWYFRSSLDHWSTYLGMIFALNFPITSLFYRKLEAQPFIKHVAAKALTGAAFLAIFIWWVTGPFLQPKLEYNQTNAYYGFIPLVTYIYFRNLTPWLRNHTLELLHQIGKTTLETYLMQHHIWLTSDAKSLLTLIPGCPKVNFLLVSVIYVIVSRRLYQLTLFLRGMVLPENKQACIRNLIGMTVIIGFFISLAHLLDWQGMLNLESVGIVSVACGILLYQFIIEFTSRYSSEEPAPGSKSPSRIVSPYMAGLLIISVCGIFWNAMSIHGASKILPLPSTCDVFANDGQWVTLNGCDEGPRGEDYRKYGISTVSTCNVQNNVKVWGWYQTDADTHCRFKQRDPKSLKTHLKKRNLYFIGDSSTRYMYHSFNRQLGLADAGAYDASAEKHGDIETTAGDVTTKFVWSAFSDELVTSVEQVLQSSPTSADIVILGGGAWDKLWRYNTDEEKANLATSYKKLATQMESLEKRDIPVVWMTPTTVNSAALLNETKRTNINEDEIEIVRKMQHEVGLTAAASFVLDGPTFTKARVEESFDGIHYPHVVYSAGAQILANAMDWLLPVPIVDSPPPPKQPGAMAHTTLGLMVLFVAALGVLGFDAFMGFSYLAAIVVPSVAPVCLYREAFSDLHTRKGLPPIEGPDRQPSAPASLSSASHEFDEEESAGLLNSNKIS